MAVKRWLALLGLLAACGAQPLDTTGARVVLERDPSGLHTADFRHYRVEIRGDGAFEFVSWGLDAVERSQRGRIEPEELQGILRAALELDFFELEAAYSISASDSIAEILEIDLAGRSRRVRNTWFGEEMLEWLDLDVPAERVAIHRGLTDLRLRIDRAVGTHALLASAIALEGPRAGR